MGDSIKRLIFFPIYVFLGIVNTIVNQFTNSLKGELGSSIDETHSDWHDDVHSLSVIDGVPRSNAPYGLHKRYVR